MWGKGTGASFPQEKGKKEWVGERQTEKKKKDEENRKVKKEADIGPPPELPNR